MITDKPLSNRQVDSSVVDSTRCTAASEEHTEEQRWGPGVAHAASPPVPAARWLCAGLCGELPLPLPLLPAVARVCSGERWVPGTGVLWGCSCRGSIDGSMACCCCVLTLPWRDVAGEEPMRDDAEYGEPSGIPGSAQESMERCEDLWLAALTHESTPSSPRDLFALAPAIELSPPAEPCLYRHPLARGLLP